MNRQAFGILTAIRSAVALSLIAGISSVAMAQGFRGGGGGGGPSSGSGGFPSPEESFRRMDRNQNGQIDPDEVPSFLRDMYAKAGMDVSRPISQQDFIQGSQKVREQFEQARSSGGFSQFRRSDGGGGPPGSGGPPSFGGPPGGAPPSLQIRVESDRGDGRRAEEPTREERREDRDRNRDERRESANSSSKASKKTAKTKTRITQDLPAEYREKDKNGDGQIGLYEWDRKAFALFNTLDRNGDGLLTPDELIAATKKNPSSDKSSSTPAMITPNVELSGDTKSSTSTSEPSKPSDASGTSSAAITVTSESSAGAKSFVGLDSNRDGKLSEEEWRRSRRTREKFENAKIELKFPLDQAQYVELYNKVEAQ